MSNATDELIRRLRTNPRAQFDCYYLWHLFAKWIMKWILGHINNGFPLYSVYCNLIWFMWWLHSEKYSLDIKYSIVYLITWCGRINFSYKNYKTKTQIWLVCMLFLILPSLERPSQNLSSWLNQSWTWWSTTQDSADQNLSILTSNLPRAELIPCKFLFLGGFISTFMLSSRLYAFFLNIYINIEQNYSEGLSRS